MHKRKHTGKFKFVIATRYRHTVNGKKIALLINHESDESKGKFQCYATSGYK